MMKAIRAMEPHDVRWMDMEEPKIGSPHDVRIRVKAGGVCGSDIHVWHGTNIYAVYPLTLGHEIAGDVESVGDEVERLKPGDRVVLEPFKSCGMCYACTHGRPNVCQQLKVFGAHIDGGFCEYLVSDEKNFHKFPDAVSYEQAVLVEPYTIAAQCAWRANVQSGDVVLIHGAGPIGLMLVDTVSRMGATVIVCEVNEYRLNFSKNFGADYVINPMEQNTQEVLNKITNGMGPNVVFEATGIPALLSESVKLASVAGRIVPLAFGKEPIPIQFSEIHKKELAILGSRHQTYKFAPVIDDFEKNISQVKALITAVYTVSEFMSAFGDFTDKNSRHCKVVLKF